MIKAEASDGYVRIQLVGTNEHDYTIKMTSECVSTIPYEEIETLDETKPVGYRELYKSRTPATSIGATKTIMTSTAISSKRKNVTSVSTTSTTPSIS